MRRVLAVPLHWLACYLMGKSLVWMSADARVRAACNVIGALGAALPDVPLAADGPAGQVRLVLQPTTLIQDVSAAAVRQ